MRIGAILGGFVVAMAAASAFAAPANAASPNVLPRTGRRTARRRGRVGRAGRDAVDRSASRDRARLAHLLAQPRRCRPADRDRLEPAGRVSAPARSPGRCRSASSLGTIGNYGYRGTPICWCRSPRRPGSTPGAPVHLAARCHLARLLGDLHSRRGEAGARSAGRRRPPRPPDPAVGSAVRRGARSPAADARRSRPGLRVGRTICGCSSRPRRLPASISRPPSFFPFDGNVDRCRGRAARGARARTGSRWCCPGRPARRRPLPATLDGVLVAARRRRRRARLSRSTRRGRRRRSTDEAGVAWWQALLLALLGGVDPQPDAVRVSDPVAEVARPRRRADRAEQRRHHGIAYAAGVVLSFAALGGVLLVAARRRRGDRLGVSAAIAGGRRAARLSLAGDGAEPVGGRRVRRRARRHRQPVRRPRGARRRVLHRRAGDNRRDAVHRAVHGRRAGLRADRAGAAGAGDFRRARRRARRAVSCWRPRSPALARSAAAARAAGWSCSSRCSPSRSTAPWRGCLGADPGGRRRPARYGAVRTGAVGFAVWVYGRTRFAATGRRRLGGGLAALGWPRRSLAGGDCRRRRPVAGDRRPARDGLRLRDFQPRPARRAHRRAQAGLRQPDRGVVHHLPRQRARDARPRRRCARHSPRTISSR